MTDFQLQGGLLLYLHSTPCCRKSGASPVRERTHRLQTLEIFEMEARLLRDAPLVVSLRIAFDGGVFDRLLRGPLASDGLGLPRDAADRLLVLLGAGGVVERHGGWHGGWHGDSFGDDLWCLSPDFAVLLGLRATSFAARVRFAALALADLLNHSDDWLTQRSRFMQSAQTFRFFDYGRARETKAAALEDTAPWVRYVTALTELEGPVLAPHIPVGDCIDLLEIGGNTGAMSLALLARNDRLTATVLDLPAVCRLGEAYVAGHSDAERIAFCAADASRDDWPRPGGRPAQMVLFKSVLHDWEAPAAKKMLQRAFDYLPPGGRVVVCERGTVEDEPFSGAAPCAADLVFAGFYRTPEAYEQMLAGLGATLGERRSLRLGMTFHIVWGTKP
ncbi:MAG: hypothetical protein ACJAQW_000614 [Paracoccaceae bacterium]|jgi:hypothetical protein